MDPIVTLWGNSEPITNMLFGFPINLVWQATYLVNYLIKAYPIETK